MERNMEQMNRKRKGIITIFAFVAVCVLLILVLLWSVNEGSIELSASQLVKGLFIEYDDDVATVYDLRFPRIIISLLVGAALAVSGVLLQSVLKNPLTDPGIIGISGGRQFYGSYPDRFASPAFFSLAAGRVSRRASGLFSGIFPFLEGEGLSPVFGLFLARCCGQYYVFRPFQRDSIRWSGGKSVIGCFDCKRQYYDENVG